MRVTRILDLAVLLLLAAVVLIPRPDVTVKPALNLDPERRERVAELQSTLIGRPADADAAVELANIYLDGHRPDWALATVDGAMLAHPDDYRLHNLRAIAYADRFEGQPAFEAATRAYELCEKAPSCGDAAHARLALLKNTLEAVAKVDMRKYPYLAKERILEQLHPAFVPRPRPKPRAKTDVAPAPKPSAPTPAK
jgi:Flp pilus assembly protein TadD